MKRKVLKTVAVMSAAMLAVTAAVGCTNTPATPSEPVSEVVVTPTQDSEVTPDVDVTPTDSSDAATEADYLAFVDGEASIKAIKDGMTALTNGSEYTLEDLRNSVNAAYEDGFEPGYMSVVEIDYAIIDCGNDGIPEMAVVVTGDNEERSNTMNLYYIVKKIDGALCVVDQYESYYRSQGELNRYGVYHSFGSGSASLYAIDYRRVNAAGEPEFIYSYENELSMAEPTIFGYELPTDANLPDGYPYVPGDGGDNQRDRYSFAPYDYIMVDGSPEYDAYLRQQVYVFHDKDGNIIYPNDDNMKIYSDAGILVTDDDTAKQMVKERIQALAISDAEMKMPAEDPDAEPSWKVAWDGLEPQQTEP